MTRNDWEDLLDQSPEDTLLRLTYADYLEERGLVYPSQVHRWLGENNKYPGPGCVLEAIPGEATWFREDQIGVGWNVPSPSIYIKIPPNWCLPNHLFDNLRGFITTRRDIGFHNRFAKSWDSRRRCENALIDAWCRWLGVEQWMYKGDN